MIRYFFVALACLMSFSFASQAQANRPEHAFHYEWKKADSFLSSGLPQSAEKIVRDILKEAGLKQDKPNMIKAKLTLILLKNTYTESTLPDNIDKAIVEIVNSSGAEKAIWQSITAGMYWQYYRNNRWKILNRSTLEQTVSDDIATWDAKAFVAKTAEYYLASVANREALKNIPVEQYLPLIVEGEHTRHLRPTLYDLLAFRAIEFFSNDEKDITDPVYRFEIDDERYFASAAAFADMPLVAADSRSLHLTALRLYRDIIAFHLKDTQPDALIDADLQRLKFVYDHSVSADKDSLYRSALQNIAQQYKGNPAVAEVLFLIQQQKYFAGNTESNYRKATPAQGADRSLPGIKQNLQQIVDRYPDTEGAAHAFNLIQTLDQQTLSVTAEEVVIPDENVKVLVQYKNVDKAYFFLYKTAVDLKRSSRIYGYDERKDFIKNIDAASLVKSWEEALPGSEDMELHSVEANAGKVVAGSYFLIISSKKDPFPKGAVSGYVQFQASNLSMVTEHSKNSLYVLNRKTGQPEENARVYFYESKYSEQSNKYTFVEKHHDISGENGTVKLPMTSNYRYASYEVVLLVKGNDSLSSGSIYTYYNDNRNKQKKETHTFFFTDRSIYRPGQTVYFKGIIVDNNPRTGKSDVVPNKQDTVTFYDANGQKIADQVLTSNAYGSFSGTFTASEVGLNGQMRISNNNGSVYIQVEEYKRPKFYVEFDTLKDHYALNSRVKVKGFAKAYAGNNIDDAAVTYRVVRQSRFPFYWCYYQWGMPSSPEREIANGTMQTQADGSFEIVFNTVSDKQVNPQSLPVFTYVVYTDVTDRNGETRSGNVRVNAGYRSLQINADIPEDINPAQLDNLSILTQNLNGIFTPENITMTIAPLQFPGKLYRKRLWQTPDKFLMTERAFHDAFPDDEYKDESDYHYWKALNVVYEKTFTTTPDGSVKIPAEVWKHNGWYVVTLTAKDDQSNEITEKKYTHLWNLANSEAVQKDVVLQSNKAVFEPGEKAVINIASAFKTPYLLSISTDTDYDIQRYKRPVVFEKIIKEEDRGGIAFSYLMVYNNRVYTVNKTLDIPWNNKELEITWATHRDKLEPGAQDEWIMTIHGDKKEKIAAELLAGMYDASLDAFKPHRWNINPLIPYRVSLSPWDNYTFGMVNASILSNRFNDTMKNYEKIYDELYALLYGYSGYLSGRKLADMIEGAAPGIQATNAGGQLEADASFRVRGAGSVPAGSAPLIILDGEIYNESFSSINPDDVATINLLKDAEATALYGSRGANGVMIITTKNGSKKQEEIIPRKNLQETAFFFPQLQTDSSGNISFRFTIPEALTEWKLMAFAHTKDWKTGYMEGKVKTQKDLMVMPNLPRFFRQGDDMVIATKVNSLADHDLNGTAMLEILNAETLQPLDLPFRLQNKEQQFSIASRQSAALSWNVHIPESIYTPVIIRIKAQAGNFTDGEENTLPVITNRMLVTETLPLPLRGNEEKTFNLDQLKNANSNTLVHRALTVEFTGNPAWYAVQALPYLMEYPHECAEQTFNRYYAHALAAHIIAQSPKIKAVFDQWKNEDTAALLSNLAKNQELKSALLEETPWVLEAKNETEQRHRVALLFETHRLATSMNKNMDQLAQMQLPEGGFPWFRGMKSNRYITQYIITGLARLQQLGLRNSDKKAIQNIIDKALPYLDRELKNDYDDLVRYKAKLEEQHIGYEQIQYLYMRSFYPKTAIDKDAQKAFTYYRNQAVQYHSRINPYLKGMLALALNRMKDEKTAQDIMASLRETAVHHEEMGMYWKDMPRGYYWYQAPVEAQSLLIEAFHEIARDNNAVDEMKTWLLKQKQTQHWATTKATADACYALLLSGSNWLAYQPEVTINLGNVKTIRSSEMETTAGTGYFKTVIAGKDVLPEMGTITVKTEYSSAQQDTKPPGWGAVYWQYFEDMDKITAAATPLSLTKQLFIERPTDKGPVLTEIKEDNPLKTGDKVKVRIVLKTDRDMEFVHLKDSRGACFEPIDVLSGYRYQNGLGYYESTKDVSTNFFFDRLPKGTYVLEYTVFVSQKGEFSNGMATAQCMYAPEFSSHTGGMRLRVE